LLSSNISSRCPHNMVNFGLLAAEIVSLVWGTPPNFNGFRVLAALLHDTLVVGVSQTAAFNRGRQLYSAGRPSGWALAHISSYLLLISMTDESAEHENARSDVVGQKCRSGQCRRHGNVRQLANDIHDIDRQDNDGQSASTETKKESSVSRFICD